MRVLKFGGTSVASAESIKEVVVIVARAVEEDRAVVVVSALAGVTNRLVVLVDRVLAGDTKWHPGLEDIRSRHKQELALIGNGNHPEVSRVIDTRVNEIDRLLTGISLIGECPQVTGDRILAAGERLSAPLVAAAFEAYGVRAEVVDGSELIEADRGPDGAEVRVEATAGRTIGRLSALDRDIVPVITGFVAADPAGHTITLGRGGSDLSAAVLGAALNCDCVEIWTDVNGVMSAPPRVVREARTLPILSAAEAAQMAYFGAKVLHPTCLAALAGRDIPVLIRNTYQPAGDFTVVRQNAGKQVGVRAVTAVEDVAVFELNRPPGADKEWGQRLDRVLAEVQNQLLVVSRTSAEGDWTFVVPALAGDRVADRLATQRVDGAMVRRRSSLLALVGSSVLAQPWIVGRALEALGKQRITVYGLFAGSTPCAISLLVSPEELGAALEIVHESLMLGSWANAEPIRQEVENGKEKIERVYSGGYRQCRSEAHSPAA
ncbi:MAG: hypothetical protein DRJ61_05820 [Acidobacteria bacterium]|nr:MAG: hypothetical protein DRJ61_05820 [Acidobacteriota bacterium]